MITRRRVLLAVLALFLVGVGYVAWTLAGLPPVKYYLCYGLDPYCGPTGEKVTYEGVEFVEIGPGISQVGSNMLSKGGGWIWKVCSSLGLPWGEAPRRTEEMPVHWAEFHVAFWIAKTELTNLQYERFDPRHKRSSYSNGDNDPVADVSWSDAKRYCDWLAHKTGRPVRLPSEAEWECASRAGSRCEYCFGDDKELLPRYAWCQQTMGDNCREVATKLPNRWGLYDFHGNALEWCADTWFSSYEGASRDGSARVGDPRLSHVFRGVREYHHLVDGRSAARSPSVARGGSSWLGFRPAMSCSDD